MNTVGQVGYGGSGGSGGMFIDTAHRHPSDTGRNGAYRNGDMLPPFIHALITLFSKSDLSGFLPVNTSHFTLFQKYMICLILNFDPVFCISARPWMLVHIRTGVKVSKILKIEFLLLC